MVNRRDLGSSGGISRTVAVAKERTGFGLGGISVCSTKTTDKLGLNFLLGRMSILLTHFIVRI